MVIDINNQQELIVSCVMGDDVAVLLTSQWLELQV